MPNLTNNGITGLWLDGKPVRRASLGGKVFFEKHDYNLSVVSDKDILSYADGDSATLTATLTDYDDPVTGETVVFSCEVKSTMVDASGTHDFGGCFIVDSTNLPRGKILHIGDRSDYSLSLMNSTYYYNNVSVDIGGFISKQWYTSKIMIKDGRLFIESSNRWVEAIDISEIDVTLWEIPTETNVTVEEYFYETGVTDVNGECSVVYDSKGTGDLNIKVECMNVSEICSIRDIYYANIGTSDKSSDFDIANVKVMNNKTKGTISITNDGEKYTIVGTGFRNQAFFPIPKLNGITSNYKFSVIVKGMGGLVAYNNPIIFARVEAPIGREVYSRGWNTENWETVGNISTLSTDTEYEVQLISNGATLTTKLLDLQGNQLGSWSKTVSSLNNQSNTVYLGMWTFNTTSTFRNLTLELL